MKLTIQVLKKREFLWLIDIEKKILKIQEFNLKKYATNL